MVSLLMGAASASNLQGLIILASDGTFLGTCDGRGTDSIANKYGMHGSSYGLESMKNTYSLYGSKYSLTSPYNLYSSDGPYIFPAVPSLLKLVTDVSYRPSSSFVNKIKTSSVGRVSINKYLTGAIDPDALVLACANP